MSISKPLTDILLVTVTEIESKAVLKTFSLTKKYSLDNRIYFDLGIVNGARVSMTISEMGSGGIGASQQAVTKSITALSPAVVIMVGIAFGIDNKKQKIGDILATEQLRLYDLQRVGTSAEGNENITLRDDKPHASPWLINLIRSSKLLWKGPEVTLGTILTGAKLIDNVDYRGQLSRFEPEAIGGEMEGAGLYASCAGMKVDWVLIKAICDFADGNKAADKKSRQRIAARNASKFTLHMLNFVEFDWNQQINSARRISLESVASPTADKTEQSSPSLTLSSEPNTLRPGNDQNLFLELPLEQFRDPTISKKFEKYLNDMELNIEHPGHGTLGLDKLYVYPDIKVRQRLDGDVSEIISGRNVPDLLVSQKETLITGDSQSGKTALAKRLFLEFYRRGYLPIMITTLRRAVSGNDLERLLSETFAQEYDSDESVFEKACPPSRRVIIVDNVHLSSGNNSIKRKMKRELRALSEKLLFLADDFAVALEDLLDFEDDDQTKCYQILPMGFERRAEIVGRWIALDSAADDKYIAQNLHESMRLIDSIFGKNFVPPYPVYIISLIQAQASAEMVDKSAGTHGYFYEIFIKASLAKNSRASQYDLYVSYLSFLAHFMMDSAQHSIAHSEFVAVHNRFETDRDLSLDSREIIDSLVQKNVLSRLPDGISFRYRYLYYYFAALRLRDTMEKETTQERIKDLARRLHEEEGTNILLFLAHLTKDPLVIGALITAAQTVYADVPPAELKLHEYVGEDIGAIKKSTREFLEKNPEDARREMFSRMDEQQRAAELASERSSPGEPSADIARLGQALAALKLLGQVAKNFPASLDAQVKISIVKECYGIGRRLLGWFLNTVKENNPQLVNEVAMHIRDSSPSFPLEKIVSRARGILGTVVATMTFAIVKRVSMAVGSKMLERTYLRVYEEDVPIVQLFDISLCLDRFGDLPVERLKEMAERLSNNSLPLYVLRELTTQHMYVFPVKFQEKQAVCAALGMIYRGRGHVRGAKRIPGGNIKSRLYRTKR